MIVYENWSFKDLVLNIERLKKEYIFYLAFFSCENDIEHKKIYNKYIKDIRDKFYKLSIKEWQIDLCWEYMNDYTELPILYSVMYRLDNKQKR